MSNREDTFVKIEAPNGPTVEVSLYDAGEDWAVELWVDGKHIYDRLIHKEPVRA